MKFKTTIRLCAGLLTAGALGAAPALAQEVVKIGYTGPLSGGAAQYGKNVLSGMEMAVKEVNDAGGFDVAGKKYKLELVAMDDKYNPSEAATNTQRLVQQHKTPAVLTPHSGGIFAMQAINEQLKVLVLGYSSVPEVDVFVQAGAEPADEGHCADVQAFLVCIGRANAVRLQALRNHPLRRCAAPY